MPIWSPAMIFGSASSGYVVEDSIWLDGSSDYLSKTFSGTGTNRKKFTFSCWFKLGSVSTTQTLLSCDDTGSDKEFMFWVQSDATIRIANYEGGTNAFNLITTPLYRDPTAWYNLILEADSTPSTPSSASIKLWINGVQVTAFSTETYPSQNFDFALGNSFDHEVGRYALSDNNLWNGYIAEMVFIDGTDYTYTDFGEFDDNDVWIPKNPSGLTFGTNGFHLDFKVAPGTGNGAGTDVSGNGNHFTDNSMTAAQQVTDTCTDDADNNIGNYATLNPLTKSSGGATTATISEGNTRWARANDGSNNQQCYATFGADAGKFYFEFKLITANNGFDVGLFAEGETNGNEGGGNTGYEVEGYYLENYGTGSHAWKVTKTSHASGGASRQDTNDTAASNDICKIAVDFDAGKIWLGSVTHNTYYSGSDGSDISFSTGSPTFTFTAGTRLFPYIFAHAQANDCKFFFNPGEWTGSAPSGFLPWTTANLPAPTVTKPSDFFKTVLYTGNGSTLAVTGAGFQPDFLWMKSRSVATNWNIYDAVRTANSMVRSNTDGAEQTGSDNELSSFDADGFTVTHASGVVEELNRSGATYVAYCWKAGDSNTAVSSSGSGSGATNACTHRANTTSGLSIIKYTGFNSTISNGEHTLVTHGLGSAPVIMMGRSLDSSQDWFVLPGENGGGTWSTDNHMHLNTSDSSSGALHVQPAFPTSTAIKIGNDDLVNKNGDEFIMYAWIRAPGMVAYGTYTGNNSADGPMVVVNDGGAGFKPAWIMIKRIGSTGNWAIRDAARNSYNPVNLELYANGTDADYTEDPGLDFTANGFKLRDTAGAINASDTYMYLAMAENPFGGDGVAQAKAR